MLRFYRSTNRLYKAQIMRKPKRRFTVSVETLEGRLLMSAAPQYTVKDLGLAVWVGGMNAAGQVTGLASGGSIVDHAVLSGPNGEPFQKIAEPVSYSSSVNDSGQTVVYENYSQDFIYHNGTFTSIGNVGYLPPRETGINNSGEVVGTASTAGGTSAFLYNGTMNYITTLRSARAINDSGQIAGNMANGHVAMFENGTTHDLGTLGGTWSTSYSINSFGQVAGGSTTSDGLEHAFFSDPNGGSLHTIGEPYGYAAGEAHSINDKGQMVGSVWMVNQSRGFYFDGNSMMDLNWLIQPYSGFSIDNASSINNNGQIAARGRDFNGSYHALLLTPVPQPTTPTITWSNPADIVYGTPISATQLNATADVPGTFTYNVAQGTVLHAGAAQSLVATFTPTDTTLYTTTTATAFLNVTKAPLTVTANNVTRIYGQPLPPLTGTITGLVNGDTDVATYSTTATTYSPTGTYPITPTLTDSNYNVTFVNGTLTQAPVRLFVESYYLARYPNVATIVASGRYPSAFAYFKAVGVYMGDMATPDWTPAIEQTYLTANPDVARAVTSGSLKSGYEHFFLYGQYQNRAGAPPLT